MMTEILMEAQDYDDHAAHLESLINFQKSPEYAERRTEVIDQIFADHRFQHEQKLAQLQGGGGIQQPQMPEQGINPQDAIARSVAQSRVAIPQGEA